MWGILYVDKDLGFLRISTIKYITNLYKNIKFDKVIYLIIKTG